jgi:PII-like signaling protein
MLAKRSRQGRRLHIFIGEAETWRGKPVYQAILDVATQQRVLVATVQRGIEGFGPEHHLNTERLIDLVDNLPMVVEIIDTPIRIEYLLLKLDPIIQSGMMTMTPVEILHGAEGRA